MFSIVMPLDVNRLEQFKKTKRVYDKFPQKKQFLIPTRNYRAVRDYLNAYGLMKDVKLLNYLHDEGFNPSKALNLAVRKARYPYIVVTSPEVKPLTAVLRQFQEVRGTNVICQVYDEDETGAPKMHGDSPSLVNSTFRNETPAMYFLALFNKADIEAINGWDEDFMKGYAYEDNDFGARWVRAGLPFTVRDDIQAIHQYHPRGETIAGGTTTNWNKFQENNANDTIRCENGLWTTQNPNPNPN